MARKYHHHRSFVEQFHCLEKKPAPSERAQFVERIARLTHRSESSVRSWLSGKVTPERNVCEILARELKTPIDQLFPTSKA